MAQRGILIYVRNTPSSYGFIQEKISKITELSENRRVGNMTMILFFVPMTFHMSLPKSMEQTIRFL
jgi:hypothetical protein